MNLHQKKYHNLTEIYNLPLNRASWDDQLYFTGLLKNAGFYSVNLTCCLQLPVYEEECNS